MPYKKRARAKLTKAKTIPIVVFSVMIPYSLVKRIEVLEA
jgi:hypothetical protein